MFFKVILSKFRVSFYRRPRLPAQHWVAGEEAAESGVIIPRVEVIQAGFRVKFLAGEEIGGFGRAKGATEGAEWVVFVFLHYRAGVAGEKDGGTEDIVTCCLLTQIVKSFRYLPPLVSKI